MRIEQATILILVLWLCILTFVVLKYDNDSIIRDIENMDKIIINAKDLNRNQEFIIHNQSSILDLYYKIEKEL